ncbi:cytochrome c oxidase subunit II [Paraburkholderia flava]|uniref:cytochrome c oxidase subunit II n=1 Tax=Paraburkholderia flava TaxID=2547393 RepID=UPI003B835669
MAETRQPGMRCAEPMTADASRRVRACTCALAFAVALLVCDASAHAAPLDYFLHAAGAAAEPTMHLGWALAALAVLITIIVGGLLAGALLRRRPHAEPSSLHGEGGGLRWVWIGTGVSSVALFAILVYVLVTLESVASPSHRPTLTITVTAYDWWWKIDYANDDNAAHVTTANEIHIPVGEPVDIQLKSADVIHAFWVPRLAGKTQAIPGVVNKQWIEADQPGIYRGQCSQFCGAQHAHMAFEVVAQTRGDFDAWLAAQAKPAAVSTAANTADIRAGQHLFIERCAGCHTVRGTDAAGVQAPDLTHLDSRRLIAAGTLVNTRENQLDWIRHAQRIKPDSLMPSIALSAAEAASLSAYLGTLQ